MLGSIQESRLAFAGARDPSVHRPPRPARALAALGELAGNLRWSWHPPTQDVFARSTPSCGSRPAATRSRLLGAVGPPGSTSSPPTRASVERSARPRATCDATSPATAGTSAGGGRGRRRARSRYFSPEFGITAVLPQYSGGLGILAGDHLKAASDLGVPIIGVGPALPARLLQAVAVARGLAAGDLPGPRPRRAADLAAARGGRHAARRSRSPCPTARRWSPGSGCASVGRVPLLMLDTDVEGNPDALPRRHRPAVRRQQRAPAAPGAAARRRRRAGAARVLPAHRRTRRPRCSTPTRATPASSASSGSASSPSPRAARGSTSTTALEVGRASHGLHHAHAGAGGHRPLPARPSSSSTSASDGADPRRAGRADPRARHRGLRGRRPVGLQHGGDGLPARAARQRRLPAARPRQPRHVQRAVAGLRRGRGADRLDHQRRARADLGGPRGRSTWPPRRAPTRDSDDADAFWAAVDKVPGDEIWAVKRQLRERLVVDARTPAAPGRGRSAAPPRPSSAGSTTRSTPTC